MLVNWTRDNIKGIPLHEEVRNVILAPGYNDIDDKDWVRVRMHVRDQIDNGIIKELWTKVEKGELSDKNVIVADENFDIIADLSSITPKQTVYIPSTLRDISQKQKAIETVLKTYRKETLTKWNGIENRDEVTRAINYQILWIDDPNKAQEMFGQTYGHASMKE